MTALRLIAGVLGLALLGVIAWAVLQTATLTDFFYETQALFDQPWGLVSLVDLYVGFGLIAILMMLSERSFIAGLLWALPLFVLGNIWTALWLVLRLPRLAERLSRPDWPTA
jgi:Protein of unknown function (DUF1475)